MSKRLILPQYYSKEKYQFPTITLHVVLTDRRRVENLLYTLPRYSTDDRRMLYDYFQKIYSIFQGKHISNIGVVLQSIWFKIDPLTTGTYKSDKYSNPLKTYSADF